MLIHNFYKNYGGEDQAVEQQMKILTQHGHNALLFQRHSKDMNFMSSFKIFKNAYHSRDTAKELRKCIEQFKPDIAHIHNVYPLISPIIYEELDKLGIPLVQTVHNYRFICPNGLMFNKGQVCTKCLDRNSFYCCGLNKCYHDSYLQSFWYSDIISKAYNKGLFDRINRFITVSRFLKDMMVRKGYPSEKISIIPNSTEADDNSTSLAKGNYILFIGRLSEEKGIMTLLKAMDGLHGITLNIAGEGALKPGIMQYLEERNIKNVNLVGFKQGKEKCELISRAKAVIVPSEWYEAFGLVAIEAFSLGTPVIVSKMGALQCLVDDYVNGLIFEPGSHLDLKKKIELLINDEGMLKQISQKAYETYLEKYTTEICYQKLMALYKEIMPGKCGKGDG